MKHRLITIIVALCTFSASSYAIEGALKGKFTVNANGEYVVFSQGNLQYQASSGTWRFAENQWDFVGNAEKGTVYIGTTKCDNTLIAEDYSGWIDLYGWGTGKNPTAYNNDFDFDCGCWPDYAVFNDWGKNKISNGGNMTNMWRTLTWEEWDYIIYTRDNHDNLRGFATVNEIKGYVLLPDDWTNQNGLSLSSSYTAEQWYVMDSLGAVFLPTAGCRMENRQVQTVGKGGHYWASTMWDLSTSPGELIFYYYESDPKMWTGGTYNNIGQSVRLVFDQIHIVRENLNDTIAKAEDLLLVVINNQYTDLYKPLKDAIDDAKEVANDNKATMIVLENMIESLNIKMTYVKNEIAVRKATEKLQAEVDAAKAYYNTIKDVPDYAGVAAELQGVIKPAESLINAGTKDLKETATAELIDAVAKAKADVANINKTAFATCKTEQKAAADALAEKGDSEACIALITKAKADIDALQYDEAKTLAANKDAIKAIVEQLGKDLAAQRAVDLAKSKAALSDVIEQATIYHGEIKGKADYVKIAADLQTAIETAQAVLDSETATKGQVDQAAETLKAAIEQAKEDVKKADEAKAESLQALSDSIAAANAILDEIKDNEEYADLIAEMRAIVDAAQTVLDNPDATQEEIDEALDSIAKAAARARKFISDLEGIEEVSTDPMNANKKIVIDGFLYIIRDGRMYTPTGTEIQ